MPDATPDPTPAPADAPVERTVLLDADLDAVRRALESPDLLSAWLGDWRSDPDGTATVVTDDGVVRHVERLDDDGSDGVAGDIAWRWSPADDPTAGSVVRFRIATEGRRTRLTVVEVPDRIPVRSAASGAAVSSAVSSAAPQPGGVSWLACLMALGAVLAVGEPAVV